MGYLRFAIAGVVLALSAVTLAPAVAATVTVEEPIADSYVNNYQPGTNYGSLGTFLVRYNWEYGYPTLYYHGFCRWDLPTLPSGAVVGRAEAKFFAERAYMFGYGRDPYILCRPLTEAWQEGTITWDNQPSYGGVESSAGLEWEKTLYVFDVTEMVKDWYANPATNYGLRLSLEYDLDDPITDLLAEFYSREGGTVSWRPKLVIEYCEAAVDPCSLGRVKAVYR